MPLTRGGDILKDERAGRLNAAWKKRVVLPSTNGGVWRVSCRYCLRHLGPVVGRCEFLTIPRAPFGFFIPANWGEPKPMSVVDENGTLWARSRNELRLSGETLETQGVDLAVPA